MTYAAITGWGKCMPPAVLDNAGLASFMDTSDEWITTRTGIRERRVSHVPMTTLSHVASMRALACAGMDPKDIDLVVLGTCSADETVPNTASAIQLLIGATKAAAMDINTACTSFLYGLSTATAMIRTGVVRNALVVGVEGITPYMDWSNRNVAVLFGDGAAAVVVQASDKEEGVIAEKLGCYADARGILRVRGMGTIYGNAGVQLGDTTWDFDGQEIFKRAVHGMTKASQSALERAGIATDQIDLVVPHQANLRIIESVAKHCGISMDRVYVTVQKYGNMSSATVPVALVEALEEGRVKPGSILLTPAFGGGLTWCSHVIRWGDRVKPLGTTDVDLPPCTKTAVEIVKDIIARKSSSQAVLQKIALPAG
jgi:3-oxoacyl-[acyl-carrier-protein] synthase-3